MFTVEYFKDILLYNYRNSPGLFYISLLYVDHTDTWNWEARLNSIFPRSVVIRVIQDIVAEEEWAAKRTTGIDSPMYWPNEFNIVMSNNRVTDMECTLREKRYPQDYQLKKKEIFYYIYKVYYK